MDVEGSQDPEPKQGVEWPHGNSHFAFFQVKQRCPALLPSTQPLDIFTKHQAALHRSAAFYFYYICICVGVPARQIDKVGVRRTILVNPCLRRWVWLDRGRELRSGMSSADSRIADRDFSADSAITKPPSAVPSASIHLRRLFFMLFFSYTFHIVPAVIDRLPKRHQTYTCEKRQLTSITKKYSSTMKCKTPSKQASSFLDMR